MLCEARSTSCRFACKIRWYTKKMKKAKRKAPGLARGANDEQLIRWTKSHDVFDRLETGVSEVVEDHSDLDEVLREAIFQDNTAQLNMRLPPAMKAVLSKLARQRTTDATTLARIWLAERLERELKAG
jgi:hypothetical protein